MIKMRNLDYGEQSLYYNLEFTSPYKKDKNILKLFSLFIDYKIQYSFQQNKPYSNLDIESKMKRPENPQTFSQNPFHFQQSVELAHEDNILALYEQLNIKGMIGLLKGQHFKNCFLIKASMPGTLKVEDRSSFKFLWTGSAGAIASFLTQPLQVIKTNRINTPTLLYADLHKQIIKNGWKQYMRGSSLAVIRQAYGFTTYTQLLSFFENSISKSNAKINKFLNYSVSAVSAKLLAMIFEAPLTLLKTRVQCVTSSSVFDEVKYIIKSPFKDSVKGLGSSVARETLYTLFHYNTYRYLKDDFFKVRFHQEFTFIPAFVAGVVALTASQPFQVLRSQISLNQLREPVVSFAIRYFRQHGMKGYFFGFVPRLIRKPINSGICWTIMQKFRKAE